ncbi:MAG: serine--tRNA ligase [Candidatus Hadarchaeota archaeon]
MLDIEMVRKNPEKIKQNLKKRKEYEKLEDLEELREKDSEWRNKKREVDELRHQRNKLSQKIGEKKKEGKDAEEEINKSKRISEEIDKINSKMEELREYIDSKLMDMPNILHESVPQGETDEENEELYRVGNPKTPSYDLKPHSSLIEDLGLGDFERASRVAGHGFFYLKDDLVHLDFAIINYAVEKLREKGFTPIEPPAMLKRDPYEGTVDLSDFEEVMYKIEDEDLYLIATSEHPIAAMFMDEIFEEDELPKKFVGVSPCFRREVGSHGIDTKGLFRVHQFNKVEQFVFSKPENSWDHHEELLENAEELMKDLEIPYRVVNVCTGDIGTVAAKKYDIEAWSPRQNEYIEVISCSNCTDYQARRLNIRMGKIGSGEKRTIHTLNSTALATSRTIVSILENNQTEDGKVEIPHKLRKFIGNKKYLEPKKE